LELLSTSNKAMKPDVNFKSDTEWTALHYACLNGNHELVSLLIYEEADIEAETSSLLTPLMIACQK
jgi:ankyrin repeat protein